MEKWIGFDAGEPHRAVMDEDDKYLYRYPLIARARAMETNASLTSLKGLKRDYSFQDVIDAHQNQIELPFIDRDMPCDCFDGEANASR